MSLAAPVVCGVISVGIPDMMPAKPANDRRGEKLPELLDRASAGSYPGWSSS